MHSAWWGLMMGTEHERIHFETSSVLIRQLPASRVQTPECWQVEPVDTSATTPEKPTFVHVDGGEAILGKPLAYPSYGWDNEYGCSGRSVAPFAAAAHPVTNGQFAAFVRAGGYSQESLWTPEGWRWVQYRKPQHPTFWVCAKGCLNGCGSNVPERTNCNADEATLATAAYPYLYRTLGSVEAFPADWPVDVNFHEAHAYCQWLGNGTRLPTEAEYHLMRGITGCDAQVDESHQARTTPRPLDAPTVALPASPLPDTHDHLHKDRFPKANANLFRCSSSSVTKFPPNSNGFFDLNGILIRKKKKKQSDREKKQLMCLV